MDKLVNTLLYVSFILLKKRECFYYPFYILLLFEKLFEERKKFKILPIPYKLFSLIVNKFQIDCFDINNCIIIGKNHTFDVNSNFLHLCDKDGNKIRTVIYFQIDLVISERIIYVSDFLYRNLKILKNELFTIEKAKITDIVLASEIDVSMISCPFDLNNLTVDNLLKNYFKTLRILSENDLIAVDVCQYGYEHLITSSKINSVSTLFFKCNKVYNKDQTNIEKNKFVFCKTSETCLKLSPNIQEFLPIENYLLKSNCNFATNCNIDNLYIKNCPYGLYHSFCDIKKAVIPFLSRKVNFGKIEPTFLIIGKSGLGIERIIKSLSSNFGLHLYKICSSNLTANIYSQTESKIKNCFFKARTTSPCLLVIENFENFGKNNEAAFDKRIIDFFIGESKSLFSNQKFPVILICTSNNKNIPAQLSRFFLETFEMSPPNQKERELNLKWVLERNNIEEHNIDLENLASNTQGFLFDDLNNLIIHSQRKVQENTSENSTKRCIEETLKRMQKSFSKQMGAPEVPKIEWSDIGGLEDVKLEIIKTVNLPLKYSKIFETLNFTRSGILLYGPPGTGKTLLAKAVASECKLCFLSVKGPELLNMYVGQSEENIRNVFEKAREASPCIIFFDELDSLAPNRGNSGDSGGVMDRIVSQLLAEMDSIDKKGFIFIIGATNRPDLIDPALLRPGRFDKLLYVGPCTDITSKMSVLKALTKKYKFSENVNLLEVLNMCPNNVSGADIYGLASSAWMAATRRLIKEKENDDHSSTILKSLTAESVIVNMEDFKNAIDTLKPSLKSEDLLYYENLKRKFI